METITKMDSNWHSIISQNYLLEKELQGKVENQIKTK